MLPSNPPKYSLRSLLIATVACAVAIAFIKLSVTEQHIAMALFCWVFSAVGLAVAVTEEIHWRRLISCGERIKGTIIEVNQRKGEDGHDLTYRCELDGQPVVIASARPRLDHARVGKKVNLIVHRDKRIAEQWSFMDRWATTFFAFAFGVAAFSTGLRIMLAR